MVAVMKAKVGDPLSKLVLLKLADNANDLAECYPSYQHIADKCEISRITAMRHIQALEAAGFLRKEVRKGKHKSNASNMFYLTIGNGKPIAKKGGITEIPGGITEIPGGGITEIPRTSHSLEPVTEPIVEPARPVPLEKILSIYNEICGDTFKRAGRMTAVREKHIRKCWAYKVNGKLIFQSAQFWTLFFNRCLLNEHWRGKNDRGWRASLEFLTRMDVMERVVDEILVEMEAAA